MNYNTEKNFGFTAREINYIVEQFFYQQVGYRAIAQALNKNEKKVRKQIAHLMSSIVG